MTSFKYKAIYPSGQLQRGRLEAQNVHDLIHRLEQSKMTLIWAKETKHFYSFSLSYQRKFKAHDVIDFTFQLIRLLESGVPILESLQEIATHYVGCPLHDILIDIIRDIEGGQPFSLSLKKHPKVFDEVYVGLVYAGEKTGKMAPLLEDVLRHLKWKEALKQETSKALRYPLILCLLMITAIVVLLIVLVPQMVDFLKSLNVPIPFSTYILIETAHFVSGYGVVTLLFLAGFGLAFSLGLQRVERLRHHFDLLLLRLPFYGEYLKKLSLLRFSHVLGVMLKNGVDLLEGIRCAQTLLRQGPLRCELHQIEQHITHGKKLSEAVAQIPSFSPLAQRILKIGEQTSSLNEALTHVHDYYQHDMKRNTERLILLLEPTLLIVVGAFITWIVLAMFWPLYETASHMEGIL